MSTHSSTFTGEISWTEEPGGLPSIGLQRIGRNRASKQIVDLYTKGLFLGSFGISVSQYYFLK